MTTTLSARSIRAAAPPVAVTGTGANPVRHARAMGLRSSNAAVPHRNRYRERARGVGRGGRAGANLAVRREAAGR